VFLLSFFLFIIAFRFLLISLRTKQIARGTQTEALRTSSDDQSFSVKPLKRTATFLTMGSRFADVLLPDYTEDDDLWVSNSMALILM